MGRLSRAYLIVLLTEHGASTVGDLMCNSSHRTERDLQRDLEQLEREGVVVHEQRGTECPTCGTPGAGERVYKLKRELLEEGDGE